MRRINTIIIDDDAKVTAILENLLSFHSFIAMRHSFENYQDAKQILQTGEIDLVFLDIMLKNENGIEIAELINKNYKNVRIIFITSQPEFALEGYRVAPTDFITKPINPIRLEQSLLRLKEIMSTQKPYTVEEIRIGIKVGSSIELIRIDEIMKVERKLRKVELTLVNDEKINCNESLKDIQKKLHPHGFVSVSRTMVLPLKQIRSLNYDKYKKEYHIILDYKNASISVSKDKFRALKDQLQEFNWII